MANIMKFLRIVKIEVIFLVIFQCSTKEKKKRGRNWNSFNDIGVKYLSRLKVTHFVESRRIEWIKTSYYAS